MLQELYKNKTIVLASNSPRRKQFLQDIHLPFTVKPSDVEESHAIDLKATAITDEIAKRKANAIELTNENEIIISCDTLVWHQDKALGKPRNFEEAFEILKSLSGETHQVISSVCIKSKEKELIFNDTTEVTFKKLSSKEISYYIENYKPYDKAGAYGIQEWIGLIGIEKINGSYSNVVGMPMERLYTQLVEFIK